MVEQAAVNCEVVGSSPTGEAIHCRVDELVSRIALNDEVAGSNPALAIKPCGVIGNIAPFEGEDSRYPSGSKLRVLVGLPNSALVDPIGRGCRLKNAMLWVRFSPRVPK